MKISWSSKMKMLRRDKIFDESPLYFKKSREGVLQSTIATKDGLKVSPRVDLKFKEYTYFQENPNMFCIFIKSYNKNIKFVNLKPINR